MCNEKIREISVIGPSYIQPIIELHNSLYKKEFTGESSIRVSMTENGYSVSIIILSVLCMESFINRIRYLDKDDLSEKFGALNYFVNHFDVIPIKELLLKKLKEIFVLRDIIVHNHIWETNWELSKDLTEISVERKRFDAWGDKKFKDCIKKDCVKTKILDLNIVPTNIGKEDELKVISVLKEFLDFLSSQKKGYCTSEFYRELNTILGS